MPLRLSNDLVLKNHAGGLPLSLVFKSIFSSNGDFLGRLHGFRLMHALSSPSQQFRSYHPAKRAACQEGCLETGKGR